MGLRLHRIRQPGSLKQTIGFGTPVDGTRPAKQECLTLAHENLEQAKVILEKGPHRTSAVLQLELALMQIGNSVALIFDRGIEGKSDPKGLHNAAAMAIVAFCRDEHPKLLNDARYASAFVRGRNDYAYRHDRIAEADLRRLFIAATKLYNGLGKVILNEEHRTLRLWAGRPTSNRGRDRRCPDPQSGHS